MRSQTPPPKRSAPWGGRPRVKDPKRRFIGVRCTDGELSAIDAAADRAGLSIGAFARAVLLGSPEPRARRRPPVEVREIARLFGEIGKIGSNVNQLAHHANAARALPKLSELRSINFYLMEMHDALMRALGREP